MSLINDALRKAQGENPRKVVKNPGSQNNGNQIDDTPSKPPKSHQRITAISLILAVACLSLLVWFSKGDIQSLLGVIDSTNQSAEPASVGSEETQTTTGKALSKPAPPVGKENKQVQSQEISTTITTDSNEQSLAATVTESSESASDPELTIRNHTRQDPVIIQSIYELNVGAVLGHGANTRIMIEGQVYRVGEMIDYTLQYRFTGEKDGTLFFTDPEGIIYEKHI